MSDRPKRAAISLKGAPPWVVLTIAAAVLLLGFAAALPILSAMLRPAPPNGPSVTPLANQLVAETAPLNELANGFVEDLRQGHLEAAHARMAMPYREAVPLERFGELVRSHPWLKTAQSVRTGRLSLRSGKGKASGTLQTSGGRVEVTFHTTLEAQGWRITGVTVAGEPALAEPIGR